MLLWWLAAVGVGLFTLLLLTCLITVAATALAALVHDIWCSLRGSR